MKRAAEGDDAVDAGKKSRTGDASVHVYQPCQMLSQLQDKMNALVEVLVPAKYFATDTDAKTIKLRQLWGTDVYTDDSDLVAAHLGWPANLQWLRAQRA